METLSHFESTTAHRRDIPHGLLQPRDGSDSILPPMVYSVPVSEEPEATEEMAMFVAALMEVGCHAMNSVRPRVTDGTLYLEGKVDSYYHKQMAQEAVRPLAIGMQVCNELLVK